MGLQEKIKNIKACLQDVICDQPEEMLNDNDNSSGLFEQIQNLVEDLNTISPEEAAHYNRDINEMVELISVFRDSLEVQKRYLKQEITAINQNISAITKYNNITKLL